MGSPPSFCAATLRPEDLSTAATAGGSAANGGHFDVLVQEMYGTVAGAEDVVEIVVGT